MSASGERRPDEWAIPLAFRNYVDRCAQTLFAVFRRTDGSSEVELRSWLFDSAQTHEDMVNTIHLEPLYTVAEFLGIDHSSKDFVSFTERYRNLAQTNGWYERVG